MIQPGLDLMTNVKQPSSPTKITVVNIVAPSYSGTTWLNLMLGTNNEGFSIGEFDWFLKWDRVFCRLHGDDCPVWGQFDLSSEENPYLQVAKITGKRFLIVNNVRRYLDTQNHPDIEKRTVLLMRDGRAVVASDLRKHAQYGMTPLKSIRSWKKSMSKKRRKVMKMPADQRMLLHYENLRSETENYLENVCDFLGMSYDPKMLLFHEKDHCFVGGNLGPAIQVAAYHNREVPLPPLEQHQKIQANRTDKAQYLEQKPQEYTDNRWQTSLTDKQLRLFALLAGRFNRKMGYPPSMERRGLGD